MTFDLFPEDDHCIGSSEKKNLGTKRRLKEALVCSYDVAPTNLSPLTQCDLIKPFVGNVYCTDTLQNKNIRT